jgi:protein-L-isoaspartate(D-aspartate) O-methyltransferase
MNNSYHQQASALHQTLVDQLKQNIPEFIWTSKIEEAFRAVPRHLFLPDLPLDQVYRDDAIVTKKEGETALSSSSQPGVMVPMLAQLGLEPGHHVLEIGSGTGYNAALLAYLVGETGKVTTIDLDEDIAGSARNHLTEAGFGQVEVICADGGYGYKGSAPYDRIIVTAGAAEISPGWREQLKPDGRIVVPLAILPGGHQMSICFVLNDSCLVSTSFVSCGFMMLRGAFSGAPAAEDREVQFGPEPGLLLHFKADDPRKVDPEEIYRLLTGPSKDLLTGVTVHSHELVGKFFLWSKLLRIDKDYRDFRCGLTAHGELADHGIVPYLFGLAGKYCSTSGLLKENSIAVWMRPPGHALPQEWPKEDMPFELCVRGYGPDISLAELLVERARNWNAAGRPPKGVKVRAYAKESDYAPSENEIVVERQHTRFVIELGSPSI